MPDVLPPTTDPHHPGQPQGRWQSGDVFRAVFFGTLAVLYGILVLPFFVGLAVLWVVGRLTERRSATAT